VNVAPVAERLVVEALVAVSVPVTEPLVKVKPVPETAVVDALPSVVWPETVSVEAVVVARVEVPVTVRVPFEVRDEVAVMDPPVRVLTVPVTALKTEAKRLVEVAFVAVRLPMNAVVRLASVDQRLVTVPLVVDALPVVLVLVNVAPVAERLVVEAFVIVEFVANELVEVAFVMTELEAKRFWVKVLRKRRVFEPSERAMSVVGRMSASTLSVE
jgi:hypothetical protein